jgi:membrane protein YdbS with pleckstrin-like domain
MTDFPQASLTPPATTTDEMEARLSMVGFEGLDPSALRLWIVSSLIFIGVLALIGLIFETVMYFNRVLPFPGLLSVPVVIVLGGLLLLYTRARFRRWGYALRETDVVIQSGVWWRARRCVPRTRVQHVDISSGPLQRAFGVCEVHLFTAGGIGAVAVIPGLSPATAERLRSALVHAETDGV